MNRQTLCDTLGEADAIEESMMGSLLAVTSFYVDRSHTFGLDEKDLEVLRAGLRTMIDDTEKHKAMLSRMNPLRRP